MLDRVTSLPEGTLQHRNLILQMLRPAAQDFLRERLVTRQMSAGEVIYESGSPFFQAVFPHSGVISLMMEMEDGRIVEEASVGLEGFIGLQHIIGVRVAPWRAVVQIPGYASWLSTAELNMAIVQFACVKEAMMRYGISLLAQTMQAVACTKTHSAVQRVSRWLLHAADRVSGQKFALTQQALASILGLRRATVSDVCSHLQRMGALEYSRGVISILDRASLKAHACECYDRVRRETVLVETANELEQY